MLDILVNHLREMHGNGQSCYFCLWACELSAIMHRVRYRYRVCCIRNDKDCLCECGMCVCVLRCLQIHLARVHICVILLLKLIYFVVLRMPPDDDDVTILMVMSCDQYYL